MRIFGSEIEELRKFEQNRSNSFFSLDWIQKRQINNDNTSKVLNHFFGLIEPYNSNSLENSTMECLRTKYVLYCEKVNSNNKCIISDTVYPEAFDFLDISRCPCAYNEPLQRIAYFDGFYLHGTSNLTLKVSTSRPRWPGDKRFAMREVLQS